jgi:hypothetical protein
VAICANVRNIFEALRNYRYLVLPIVAYWGDPDVDGKIILTWIFRKLEGVVGTGWRWLRIGTGGGHL